MKHAESAATAAAGSVDGRPATMAAIVQDAYGSAPEDVLRLTDVPVPGVGRKDVLVRVHAASVDRGTWHLMAGLPYPARLAFGLRRPAFLNPGRTLAGTVRAVGAAVTGFRPGDAVFGIPGGNGAFGIGRA